MTSLWSSTSRRDWRTALARYDTVISAQGVPSLAALDAWYHGTLPGAMAERREPHLTHAELVRLTEWKMARGVWRAPNLVLVRGNDAAVVAGTSRSAFAMMPDPKRPVSTLATLAGVGPATASAALSAIAPDVYPFFDELVAAEVPGLGKVVWTLGYYVKYAARLRDRASELGDGFTPTMVERALWASTGGKFAAK